MSSKTALFDRTCNPPAVCYHPHPPSLFIIIQLESLHSLVYWPIGEAEQTTHALLVHTSNRIASAGRRFQVHFGEDASSWRNQKNGLPQGSVLAPIHFNLYTNDLPVTGCRKFIYADDICLGQEAHTSVELECALTADMACREQCCRHLRLKSSLFKTVCSVFHLHNANSGRELKVTLNGQPLRQRATTTQLNSTQRASMDAGVKTPQCPHLSRHYFISIL